jgi:predicted RNA methylase
MLKDESRTKTYREAFQKLSAYFKDKVVMDVGTGTSVLAFFAVEAGAKIVYAVEASNLATWTEKIVFANGKQDKIKIIRGRVEEVSIPEPVDIIISEWMGTFLIFISF